MLVGLIVVAMLIPPALAEPIGTMRPPPPMGLGVSWDSDSQQPILHWKIPPGDPETAYVYTIYRDGIQIGQTQELHFLDAKALKQVASQQMAAYQVTAKAVGIESGESLPTPPALLILGTLGATPPQGPVTIQIESPLTGLPCGFYTLSTNSSRPPFIFLDLHRECIAATLCLVGSCPGTLPPPPSLQRLVKGYLEVR